MKWLDKILVNLVVTIGDNFSFFLVRHSLAHMTFSEFYMMFYTIFFLMCVCFGFFFGLFVF